MPEYIDKKAILQNAISRFHCVPLLYNGIDYDAIHIDDFLNQLPTADVTPMKHGSWIEKQFPMPLSDGSKTAYKCSNCGTTWDYKTNYCPHCGARMEGATDAKD